MNHGTLTYASLLALSPEIKVSEAHGIVVTNDGVLLLGKCYRSTQAKSSSFRWPLAVRAFLRALFESGIPASSVFPNPIIRALRSAAAAGAVREA